VYRKRVVEVGLVEECGKLEEAGAGKLVAAKQRHLGEGLIVEEEGWVSDVEEGSQREGVIACQGVL